MVKTKNEAQNAADCQVEQSAAAEVSLGSSSVTARASTYSVARDPGSPSLGLSPLSACILRLAKLGRQQLALEAQAMLGGVNEELRTETHENLD
jgi:hypothetical protein